MGHLMAHLMVLRWAPRSGCLKVKSKGRSMASHSAVMKLMVKSKERSTAYHWAVMKAQLTVIQMVPSTEYRSDLRMDPHSANR